MEIRFRIDLGERTGSLRTAIFISRGLGRAPYSIEI